MMFALTLNQYSGRTNIAKPYIVINPNGGSNPGMMMDSKRWPPHHYRTGRQYTRGRNMQALCNYHRWAGG